ncbi:MAG: SGNH/GDSL hydrolase family protein [Candidatus Latescibacterota bacterium]
MDILERLSGDYFGGVVGVEWGRDGVLLKRVTDGQMGHYEGCNDRWPLRAHCNAGCVLELRTDSRVLDISFSVVMGARQYLGLDVEVDGQVVRSVYVDDFSKPEQVVITNNARGEARVILAEAGRFTLRLFEYVEQKERTVCVYLPQSVALAFTGVVVDDGAVVEPVERPQRKLLCLGDSITQGMDSKSPMAAYTTQLARLLDAELLNQGVGGHVFDADSFDMGLAFDADVVTIAYGTNDWNGNKTVSEIENNVRAYLTKVKARFPSVDIYVLSPIWRVIGNEVRQGGNLWDFSQVILKTAQAFDRVTCIDGLVLMPHQEY